MRTGRRGRRRVAALAVTGALLALPALTACAAPAGPVDSIERLGRRAAEEMGPRPPAPPVSLGDRERTGRAAMEGRPVERAAVRTADREGKRCLRAPEPRTTAHPITPRSDELALRLTEC
ncbi:hypothetical protein [Streptomyces sp. NPDC096068]|uniref:hypothetical protein n=1 Tax=Streptomyces sp. NPDC096068 TaxID=3155424 RepID=UPI00332C08BD